MARQPAATVAEVAAAGIATDIDIFAPADHSGIVNYSPDACKKI